MTTAQATILVTGLLLLITQLLAALRPTREGLVAAFNIGPPAALAALAGGIAVLVDKANTLKGVSSIQSGFVMTEGERLNREAVSRFGDRLLVDDIVLCVVFAVVVAVAAWEVWKGDKRRNKPPVRFMQWVSFVCSGFVVTAIFGAGALYLIYTRTT
jgi:hypothetical protein